jgi:hypothetical protein
VVGDRLNELFIYKGIVGEGEKSVDIGPNRGIYIIRPSENIVLIENVVYTKRVSKYGEILFSRSLSCK